MNNIKVGYLISYDYEFIKTSLPRVYDFVEEIYFAVDIEGKTWSGQSFEIKDEFWQWVKEFDKAGKITIYEDRFYIPELSPIECDTRERNLLAKKMGDCDWYIQIDSDEYFVDFASFADKLKNYQTTEPTTIMCRVATLFKEISAGYLLISESVERLNFATNNPVYHVARNNNSGNKHLYLEDLVLHQSWARSPEDIYMKLNNWSHKDDFNVNSFYNLWTAIDENNYHAIQNFHPLTAESWPKLKFIKGSIKQILDSNKIDEVTEGQRKNIKRKPLLSRLWKELKS